MKAWINLSLEKARLLFVGLQGSYGRGEEAENSGYRHGRDS